MSKLRIQLLGGLQVYSGPDQPIAISARKAQALLAFLARHPDRPQPRAKLAALLWEDSVEAQQRGSLRQTLAVLRMALGPAGEDLIANSTDVVTLASGQVRIDVLEFERLVRQGTEEALEAAVALYGGEFLEAFNPKAPAFEEWLVTERQRLRERALEAMSALLGSYTASGTIDRAIEVALRLLSLDPLQESVHRSLMSLYARQGRQASALRQFHLCRELLRREVDVAPEPETERLFQEIRGQRRRRTDTAAVAPSSAGAALAVDLETPTETLPQPEAAGRRPLSELRHVIAICVEISDPADDRGERDPEQMQRRADRLVGMANAIADTHGGVVEVYVGGSVAVFFGASVAHGNDAERAARAALQLKDAACAPQDGAQEGFDLRVGIADGRALVTRTEETSDRPLTITGDTANVAASLAATANDGEILVSEAVYHALAHLADDVEPRDVLSRASDKPVRAWRLRSLRTRPSSWGRPGFVGRHAELAQFSSAAEACRETKRGLTIHVRGEAGIGKTRLVEEFQRLAGERGFACRTGLVLDFGAGRGQDAIRVIVQGLLGLSSDTVDQAMVAKAAAGLIDRDRQVYLYDLLQCPQPLELRALYDAVDNDTRTRGRQETLAQLVRNASARQPNMIVIEDLHWADPSTLAQAAAVAAAAAACSVILVMTARGEGDPLTRAWRGMAGGGPLITMDLGPLYRQDALALASAVADATDPFAIDCIERAGGNPLFLEQLLRGDRRDESRLPGTVQSVVLARMDRLDASDRQALRAASVLGQLFSLPALRHLLGDPLYECGTLLEHSLARPTGGDYLFAHALVREGAYSSLPTSERQVLHRRAAEWFAERDPIVRAEHLDRADDPAAPQAYLEAARSEAAAYRHDKALTLVGRGLALAGDADRFALACYHGELLHDLGAIGEARTAYEEALALALNDSERCRARLGLAAVKRITDDLDGAFADLKSAEEAAERLGFTEEAARAHFLHGNLLFPRGDLEGCLREHRRSLELARQAASAELEAAALGGLGDVEYMRGRMISAHAQYRQCVELAERHGFGRIAVANRPMMATALYYAGDIAGTLREALLTIDAAAKVGHQRAELIAHMNAYISRASFMEIDAGWENAEAALRLARQIGAPRFEAEALAFRGDVHRLAGRPAEALADLDEALAISRLTGMTYMGPWYLGLLAAAAEDATTRNNALEEGETLLATNSVGHNHPNFRKYAIDACLAGHDWSGAIRHAEALEVFTRPEPLPWSSFFAARGRALTAYCNGERGIALTRELKRLMGEGEKCGFRIALPEIEAALDGSRAD